MLHGISKEKRPQKESNPQPPVYKTEALPIELCSHFAYHWAVGCPVLEQVINLIGIAKKCKGGIRTHVYNRVKACRLKPLDHLALVLTLGFEPRTIRVSDGGSTTELSEITAESAEDRHLGNRTLHIRLIRPALSPSKLNANSLLGSRTRICGFGNRRPIH